MTTSQEHPPEGTPSVAPLPPELIFQGSQNDPKAWPQPLPPSLAGKLHPATHYLYEWTTYQLDCPGADRLQVGHRWLDPEGGHHFHLLFKNALGLTHLQPYCKGRPLCEPLHCEVLSPKVPEPGAHLAFYDALLQDLVAEADVLPFSVDDATAVQALASPRQPTPLFALYFFLHNHKQLAQALSMVQANPHRLLTEREERVPLAEVTELDADTLTELLSADDLAPGGSLPIAQRLGGYLPQRVRQRLAEETTDTPENRFVLSFLRQVLRAADCLMAQPWWESTPAERQSIVRGTAALLRQAFPVAPFDEAGEMQRMPANSQVLLRREGYREMRVLWQRFQRSHQPFFGPLQHAIDVRDIAKLYEFWAFFALSREIGVALGHKPDLDIHTSDQHGLKWNAKARYGGHGTLLYNHKYRHPRSYSVALWPDFAWVEGEKPRLVFDAKFRLEWPQMAKEAENHILPTAALADIYKMHTYRDALQLRAAIAVYPGHTQLFYPLPGTSDRPGTDGTATEFLSRLFAGELSGVGALPLRPDRPLSDGSNPTEEGTSDD